MAEETPNQETKKRHPSSLWLSAPVLFGSATGALMDLIFSSRKQDAFIQGEIRNYHFVISESLGVPIEALNEYDILRAIDENAMLNELNEKTKLTFGKRIKSAVSSMISGVGVGGAAFYYLLGGEREENGVKHSRGYRDDYLSRREQNVSKHSNELEKLNRNTSSAKIGAFTISGLAALFGGTVTRGIFHKPKENIKNTAHAKIMNIRNKQMQGESAGEISPADVFDLFLVVRPEAQRAIASMTNGRAFGTMSEQEQEDFLKQHLPEIYKSASSFSYYLKDGARPENLIREVVQPVTLAEAPQALEDQIEQKAREDARKSVVEKAGRILAPDTDVSQSASVSNMARDTMTQDPNVDRNTEFANIHAGPSKSEEMAVRGSS